MKPNIWGPSAWIYLHLLSMNYPENPTKQDVKTYKIFLEYFGKTLPCDKCQNNFSKHIKNFNLDTALESKSKFINFIWKLHNKVNKDINKKTMSFNDFINIYDKLIDSEKLNLIKNIDNINLYRKIIIVLLISIILIVLFIVYYKLKVLN